MKFRITIGPMSSVEKPFIIQYKKFLFWKTFKHWIGNESTIPYFSRDNAEKMLAELEDTIT